MRILVVDDNQTIVRLISGGLKQQGYAVDVAYNGDEAESLAENFPYDVIILDIMMPGRDGIQVCQSLRRKKIKTPILMLTAKDTIQDITLALDRGADDYLTKPFVFQELCARIRTLLRRGSEQLTAQIQAGDLVIDTAKRQVWLRDREIDLTMKEYSILEYLGRNQGALVTRRMLEQHVWNGQLDSNSNLVEVYITKLRAKLDEGNEDSIIKTIWGGGYKLKG